jgi:hypothetical protein
MAPSNQSVYPLPNDPVGCQMHFTPPWTRTTTRGYGPTSTSTTYHFQTISSASTAGSTPGVVLPNEAMLLAFLDNIPRDSLQGSQNQEDQQPSGLQ